MLDIELFRADKGGKPDLIRESQKRRFADVTLVDQVIELDNEWRRLRTRSDFLNKMANMCSKTVGAKMKAKEDQGSDATIPQEILSNLDGLNADILNTLTVIQLKTLVGVIKEEQKKTDERTEEVRQERDRKLVLIGNIVHEDVPVHDDEDYNRVEREWKPDQERPRPDQLLNHVDLMLRLDGIDTDSGANVAGSRAYFLKGPILLLNLALINYAINFLVKKGYSPIYPPFFMNKTVMSEVAQLEQFDEELYKVSGEGEDKYLIATSEQPIAAYHRKMWYAPKDVPIRYVGYSTCFRKEAGSHGRDTLGIFRVHQFDKVEQFCVTKPHENASWEMMDEMITNSEEFYKSLGLPFRVVNIVSGKLNNAAAKKLDLEAWFPASEKYRELVSCSNCTDYQARRLETRYGIPKPGQDKEYVHMLNATLCATTRTMCCIVENYQTDKGVVVPDVLVPYMGGTTFLPFTKELPKQNDKK